MATPTRKKPGKRRGDPRRDPRRDVRGTKKGPPRQQQEWSGETDAMEPRPDHGEESYRGSGKLEGLVALITGGDSGIGRAVAIAFAREGADVAVTWFEHEEEAAETVSWVERAGRRGLSLQADLQDPRRCRDVVERTVRELGQLDVLVNNAAYQREVDFLELTPEQVERTFRTNVLNYLWTSQAAVPHMAPGSVILNTGSVTALEGHATLVDYAATKGGIHVLTRSLAKALAERGIRVNCIAPGPVWTPLIPATLDPDHVERFGSSTLWERPAQPAELAPSYVFLASADAAYYTGDLLAPTGRTPSR